MECPKCASRELKVDLCERSVFSGYFYDGQMTDYGSEASEKIWFTKWSEFRCYGCNFEGNIKYLKGELLYPVMDTKGIRDVKLKRCKYKKQREESTPSTTA